MLGGFSLSYTSDLKENERFFDQVFRVDKNFDLVKRPVFFADKRAVLYFIDGFVKDEIMEKISRSGLSSLTEEEREVLRRASRR